MRTMVGLSTSPLWPFLIPTWWARFEAFPLAGGKVRRPDMEKQHEGQELYSQQPELL